MRIATALALVLIAAAPVAARAQEPAQEARPVLPTAALPPEVERVLRDYERLWMAGDAAGLAGLFAEDGFVLQNGQAPVRGRDAIRAAYARAGGSLRLRALGYEADGTVGYIVGAYGYGEGEGDMGKFVLALRRAPGGPWMIAADIDNMNRMPRMGPPPSPQP